MLLLLGRDRSVHSADGVRSVLSVGVVDPTERMAVVRVRVPTQTPATIRVTVEVAPEREEEGQGQEPYECCQCPENSSLMQVTCTRPKVTMPFATHGTSLSRGRGCGNVA